MLGGALIWYAIFFILNNDCYGYITCPSDCQCNGRTVDCTGDNLSDIPTGIITVVKTLNLKKNKITQLSRNSFAKFKLLRQLNLGFNQLSEIEDGDFNGLLNLRTLDLSFNRIKAVHKNSFKQLVKVNDIILRGNVLSNVDGVFTDMVGLNRLDLSNNQIDFITNETFKNMTSLRYLLLRSNRIVSIQDGAFYDVRKLTYISMTGNPITNVDGLFVKNNVLSFIELTNCSIKTFPKGLPLITRFLYLNQNNISSITRKEIERVESLVNLILSENQIKTIEKTAFTVLNSLMELWIDFNLLSEIPLVPVNTKRLHLDNNEITHIQKDDFPFGSKLETLSIKSNKISAINQDTFGNLINLNKLYLGGNIISTLANYAFKPLPLLDDLGLTGMDINHIEQEAFNALINLQTLTMSYVWIGENAIQGNVFKYLTNLKILDLQESPSLTKTILQSADIIKSFFTLEQLNIMDNELAYVDSNIMKYMPRLSIIKLGGNQFHCDRRLLWLWKWIDMEKYKFQDADSLECYSPPELRGSSLLSLKANQFVPTTLKPEILTRIPILHKTTPRPNILLNSSNVNNVTFDFVKINETWIELTTSDDLENNRIHGRDNLAKYPNNNKDPYDDQIDKILLITVITTVSVVLLAVVITAISCLKCNRRKKEGYNHTNSFPDNDVTFYVISDGDTAPPLPPPNSARKERGSVGSTRDITGDNVFIFDNDSS